MRETEPLRVGLVGLGAVGALHLQAYQHARGIRVVAAAEPVEERLKPLAEHYGIGGYRDLGTMLAAENLDIACVLTPASTHRAVTEEIAAAGVAVLTEKPMSITAADAEAMMVTCTAAGVPLFYGSSYRFLPAVLEARRLILKGAIGTVRLVREHVVGGTGPAGQRPCGSAHYPAGSPGGTGMGLVDHGIHLLDIIPWLLDSHIISVFGRGNISGKRLDPEVALLTLASGAIGTLTYDDGTWPTELPHEGSFSWGADWGPDGPTVPGRWQEQPGAIHVHGTEGSLRILHYANALFLRDQDGHRQMELAADPAPLHFARQLETFAEDIRSGRPPRTPAEAGVQALQALEAIYRSAYLGSVVELFPRRSGRRDPGCVAARTWPE